MQTSARGAMALALTREQVRLVVEGLADRPFRQVFELIGQLHAGASGAPVALTPAQLRLLLQSLRAMPAGRAGGLVRSIHRQMRRQRQGGRDD